MLDVDAVPFAAFGLADDLEPFHSDWHRHRRHQILFASGGVLSLQVGDRRWLLPPQKAAWIAGDVSHTASSKTGAHLRTVYLDPSLVARPPTWQCRVFPVTPLAREMLLGAMRWGPDGARDEALATAYFTALAGLAREWAEDDLGFHLPVSRTPELERAMQWALDHLHEPISLAQAAKAARSSVRTLTRRFEEEAQTTWRAYLQTARMVRAMERLGEPDTRVTDVAFAVGFGSHGAFTEAFRAFAGETPTAYRARALARRAR